MPRDGPAPLQHFGVDRQNTHFRTLAQGSQTALTVVGQNSSQATFAAVGIPGYDKLCLLLGVERLTKVQDSLAYIFADLCAAYGLQHLKLQGHTRPLVACTASLATLKAPSSQASCNNSAQEQAGTAKVLVFAKDLQAAARKVLQLDEGTVPIRIGIHAGPCCCKNNDRDCESACFKMAESPVLRGTVDRVIMEQRTCLPDRIQMSASALQLLLDGQHTAQADWQSSGPAAPAGPAAPNGQSFMWIEPLMQEQQQATRLSQVTMRMVQPRSTVSRSVSTLCHLLRKINSSDSCHSGPLRALLSSSGLTGQRMRAVLSTSNLPVRGPCCSAKSGNLLVSDPLHAMVQSWSNSSTLGMTAEPRRGAEAEQQPVCGMLEGK